MRSTGYSPNMVFNGAECLVCGDLIESKKVNDFVMCSCKNVSIDGGLLYSQIGAKDIRKAKQLTLYDDNDFEKIRILVNWDYGKGDSKALEHIPIALLTDEDIETILISHEHRLLYNPVLGVIKKEKLYRKMNKDEIQSSI